MTGDDLGNEAGGIGLAALRDHGDIPRALYEVYMFFRRRFIKDRGLDDSPPGGAEWVEALSEARALEANVARNWSAVILRSAD